ncbi:MAG: hypothetical protein RR497_06425 [Oscillospiraceae bacterium]
MKKIICFLMTMAICCSFLVVVSAEDGNSKLYFNSQDGKLYYEPQNTAHLDTFLNLQEMSAGTTYKDVLEISNSADRTYELFFQILPDDPTSPDSQFFLKNISMKIFYDDEVLFDGTADALTKTSQSIDLSQMASIGEYKKNQKRILTVEVTLNKDFWQANDSLIKYYPIVDGTGTKTDPYIYSSPQDDKPLTGKYEARTYTQNEYKSYMAKTNWKFYAKSDDAIVPIDPPITSDGLTLKTVVIITIVLISVFLIIIISKKNDKKDKKAKTY